MNLAAQLDVSWAGWAWRGPAGGNCGYPDVQGTTNGVLTDGSFGGANWADVWRTFMGASVVVQDLGDPHKINITDYEVKGFLPRPCIVPAFGMGSSCGWPLGYNGSLPWVSMWNQSVGESVLPGLPPSGPPAACTLQACPGYACSTTSPVVPMPHPCS